MGVAARRKFTMAVLVLVLLRMAFMAAAQQVPCYFIFGDSLVDNGNNNNLASLARANYQPYGIDLPQGPTGRFSNGLTTVDVIGKIFSSIDGQTTVDDLVLGTYPRCS